MQLLAAVMEETQSGGFQIVPIPSVYIQRRLPRSQICSEALLILPAHFLYRCVGHLSSSLFLSKNSGYTHPELIIAKENRRLVCRLHTSTIFKRAFYVFFLFDPDGKRHVSQGVRGGLHICADRDLFELLQLKQNTQIRDRETREIQSLQPGVPLQRRQVGDL